MELFRRTYADINLENLVHNWNQIRRVAGPERFICPMVKANAYGHGDVQVAQTLEKEGALGLGVCLIEEGLILRAAGIKADILVFRGFDRRGAEKIMEYQLTPVVSSWQQIEALESAADAAVKVHLKFDTGMNRLGFDPSEAEALLEYFGKSRKLKLKAVLSHLACGEDAYRTDGFSALQMQRFGRIAELFKSRGVYAHLFNSGGIASLAKGGNPQLAASDWGFRPGLMLYGYQPAPHFNEIDLRPVMTLKSVVNNIRSLAAGDSVSYGCTWKAARPSRIAVVPIGYADGIHRLLSNRSVALLNGIRVPVVGRICMDFLMLDVTDVVPEIPSAVPPEISKWTEEDVVLFGYDEKNNFLSAEELSSGANTIVWEVLTSIGERVPRHFKGLKKT